VDSVPTGLETTLTAIFSDDPNVAFALMFGSRAGGAARRDSDLDVALFFHAPPTGLAVLDFRNDWSNLLGVEVDLVILNNASPFLRHQVMKTGRKLVVNDPRAYLLFRERTIFDYQEYRWWTDRRAEHVDSYL